MKPPFIQQYTGNRFVGAAGAFSAIFAIQISSLAGPSSKEPVTMLKQLPAADSPAAFSDLFTKAKPTVDLRLRYEYGDQDGRNASHAETLRGRIGLLSGTYEGFQAFAEYEGTFAADRNSYQAASIHGLGQNKTIIADPESNELNRAWLKWAGGDTEIKAGRQRIIVNNARYMGNVGWRQNEQTYDAVTLKQGLGDLSLTYGVFNQTLRIFGSDSPALAGQQDFDGTSHFGHVVYTGLGSAKLGAYAFFLDLENDAGSANSNNSYGAYIDGSIDLGGAKATYYGEYGHQTDGAGSPLDYSTNYFHVKTGLVKDKHSIGIGFESLGSDNGVGYKFPLGTNHAFNGFADKFLGTPADGLDDAYVYAGTSLPGGVALKLFYHWFGSNGGSLEYGQEIDAVLVKKLSSNLTILGKAGIYSADEFATDTTRFSVELGYKF